MVELSIVIAGDMLAFMTDVKRIVEQTDRRERPRGGRRTYDQQKPWYMRRRLWLAAASMVFIGWKRVRRIV